MNCNNSKGSRESEAGGSGNSVPHPPITSNNAATNIIANANSISTATATVHATTIVAPLQFIITLPTTIATTISHTTSQITSLRIVSIRNIKSYRAAILIPCSILLLQIY